MNEIIYIYIYTSIEIPVTELSCNIFDPGAHFIAIIIFVSILYYIYFYEDLQFLFYRRI